MKTIIAYARRCQRMQYGEERQKRLAMLVDGENATPGLLHEALAEASKHGKITARRIYGNWTDPDMNGWQSPAKTLAFMTQHQQAHTTGKNASDMFLVIEAMDLLHSGDVEGFCLVSSDSDFTGLAKRLREAGMLVVGIGRKTTPESFRNACEVFVFEEILALSSQATTPEEGQEDKVEEGDDAEPTPWQPLVSKAIEAAAREDGWANLSDVGNSVRKLDSSFDVRSYGSSTLLSLIRTESNAFDLRDDVPVGGAPPVYYVRLVN